MDKPSYANHQYYIDVGWAQTPKERFKAIIPFVERNLGLENLKILDVGCATGELLGYLAANTRNCDFVGCDVSEDLLVAGRALLPAAEFRLGSAINLPKDLCGRFDLVTSIGCMSIFDNSELAAYWENLLAVCRPGGLIVMLAPMNEYGVDVMTQHRKRIPGRDPVWETGWNIHSLESVSEVLASLGQTAEFHPFRMPFGIERHRDPVRTWTVKLDENEFQLTNGLKLLINHYFAIVRKR